MADNIKKRSPCQQIHRSTACNPVSARTRRGRAGKDNLPQTHSSIVWGPFFPESSQSFAVVRPMPGDILDMRFIIEDRFELR